MRKFILLLIVAIVFFSCGNSTQKSNSQSDNDAPTTTTFYLVRHAEKDLTVKNDPVLTPQGEERAKKLATYFKNIDAVYSTPYIRTQETAKPTALANNLDIQTYQPNKLFNKALLKKHKGQQVLIVGHSNTIPQLVNKIMGDKTLEDIPDEVYNRIYKVEFVDGKATSKMTILD
ncbi:phosphoglycerate mutase family protein [Patiriisocius marinus]|uniref:Phosphoglycerate mutase n=1 Tax=Patiriisocius marinus TaxID=1397112 RepID=A0A5J4ISC9_9FLAO|nr:phosphoglycerate mutase family protein [Patiriisocius marinus]GER60879.1 phosphoglycerate mutase [Patiriisocius marinus]